MKKFIAYFDYLGFKDFIENNDNTYHKKILGGIFRDIEFALAHGKIKKASRGVIADMSDSKFNCINFSDTVVFWTNDDLEASLNALLEVSYTFNWQAIDYSFPVRGAIVFGEIEKVDFQQSNEVGGTYNINSIYGKGFIAAYVKAENQNWAGTVIDKSLIDEMEKRGNKPDEYLAPFARKYRVPYKKGNASHEEFVFCIVKGTLNVEAYKNMKDNIMQNFKGHNKSVDHPSAREKLANTILFLDSFKEPLRD